MRYNLVIIDSWWFCKVLPAPERLSVTCADTWIIKSALHYKCVSRRIGHFRICGCKSIRSIISWLMGITTCMLPVRATDWEKKWAYPLARPQRRVFLFGFESCEGANDSFMNSSKSSSTTISVKVRFSHIDYKATFSPQSNLFEQNPTLSDQCYYLRYDCDSTNAGWHRLFLSLALPHSVHQNWVSVNSIDLQTAKLLLPPPQYQEQTFRKLNAMANEVLQSILWLWTTSENRFRPY